MRHGCETAIPHQPDLSGDPLFIAIASRATNSYFHSIKSPVSSGFYGHFAGASSLALAETDCEIQSAAHLGNGADGAAENGNDTTRRGLSSIHTRLPGVLAMPGFFALRFFVVAPRVVGKLITRVFAAARTPAARSFPTTRASGAKASGAFYGQGCPAECGHGGSHVSGLSATHRMNQSNPPASFSLGDAGFGQKVERREVESTLTSPPSTFSLFAWDESSLIIPDPVARGLPIASGPRANYQQPTTHYPLVRDLLLLAGAFALVLILAGCQSKNADASLGQSKGNSEAIGDVFQTIRYHAEEAKKEIAQ